MFKKYFYTITIIIFLTFNIYAKVRKTIDNKSKREIIHVLEVNEKLFGAFYDYDGNKIEKSALKLKDAIGQISNPEISKLLTFSVTKLEQLKKTSSREENNQNYHLISMALIYIVATYDIGDVYNAYSCPMVKKKWIQNTKKMEMIHNPYAPQMPQCGEQDTKY